MPETSGQPSGWEIVGRPKGSNRDGRNDSGLIIELKHRSSGTTQEIGRVAYVRTDTGSPNVDFKTQAEAMIRTAREAVETLNKLVAAA